MANNQPLIHLFSTYRFKYMYDANKNQILKVDDVIFEYLQDCMSSKDFYSHADSIKDEMFVNFYTRSKNQGFFNPHKVKEVKHPASDMIPHLLSKGLNGVALQVTQMCNLRCEYCPYSGHLYVNRQHSGKRMPWETAKKAIDFYIAHSPNSYHIGLAFYGGEPLLEFELIKKCVNYIENKVNDKKIRFDLTTNATLLTDEMIEFFVKHDFQLLISLDGPEEIHNRFRKFVNGKGSFQKVIHNVRKYKDKHPDYFSNKVMFNSVINPDKAVTCISDFYDLDSTFADAIINASPVSDSSLKDEAKIYSTSDYNRSIQFENFKVILNRLGLYDGTNLQRPSIFTGNYQKIRELSKTLLTPLKKLPDSFHPGGPCIPGLKKFFISVDGKFLPCERVNENSAAMSIGNLDEGINFEQIGQLINVGKLTENNCKNCWAFLHCSQCCAQCEQDGELSAECRLKRCRMIKENVESDLQAYCFYKEFGYDFGIEKTYYFSRS
ncbi:Cys-rich peptide radical SAM maturase CcpM [Paenibacillus brasilensis]|uniref:Radical SAM core domain-containing protein n=1 Tax=Paenibacillus brasilensis TaxID=128574 RepID=A0ABU0L1R6_9BACL|nr:Cys-rich peptide radical SAM maturase CcpM [Paenibacillus brasilensis]MDQ0495633.1 uncharacterized protein [Paenibacillus brasilensis]